MKAIRIHVFTDRWRSIDASGREHPQEGPVFVMAKRLGSADRGPGDARRFPLTGAFRGDSLLSQVPYLDKRRHAPWPW